MRLCLVKGSVLRSVACLPTHPVLPIAPSQNTCSQEMLISAVQAARGQLCRYQAEYASQTLPVASWADARQLYLLCGQHYHHRQQQRHQRGYHQRSEYHDTVQRPARFLCIAGGMLLSMKGWREARVQCQDLNKAANAKTYAPSHVSAPAGQVVTAPMYRRTLALIIDIVVGKAVNALCTLALKLASMGWGFVITDESAKAFGNVVQFLYVREYLFDSRLTGAVGQTFGKKLMGIQTIVDLGNEKHEAVRLKHFFIENLLRAGAIVPTWLGNEQGKAVHNYVAGTRVVMFQAGAQKTGGGDSWWLRPNGGIDLIIATLPPVWGAAVVTILVGGRSTPAAEAFKAGWASATSSLGVG